MFEPIGGSAPKYTGKNVINPMAAIGAMAMMLQVIGDQKNDPAVRRAGDRVIEAIKKSCPKMKSQSAGKMGMARATSAIWSAPCCRNACRSGL